MECKYLEMIENFIEDTFGIYKDINARTGGEIYLGIVGPVRTGKSTFIKRFMETMVLPGMESDHERERTIDELPQSSTGRTIMTTEPKFIPKNAAKINISEDMDVKVRLVDCVGFMVEGATGHIEDNKERMVKTPWYDETLPFSQAAELGTRKVINEHSTIGIVVTTDGSFGEIPRDGYIEAEKKTINELKSIGKPFIVLLNTSKPYNKEVINIAMKMEKDYGCRVLPVNCMQLKKEDINRILENVLYEFPVSRISFYMPKWLEILDESNYIKAGIIEYMKKNLPKIKQIKDLGTDAFREKCDYITKIKTKNKDLSTGNADFEIEVEEKYYYEALSELAGTDIDDEYALIEMIRNLTNMKNKYEKVAMAVEEVNKNGYGVVRPETKDIILDEPEVIKNGNKYGVKINAKAPSVHMIKTDILTEIAPIVGSEEQARDLIEFIIKNGKESEDGIWSTNIFGKSIEEIVNDGISSKIDNLTEQTRVKMQEAVSKITNESKGGVIFLIL